MATTRGNGGGKRMHKPAKLVSPLVGQLLVASPYMVNSHFSHTVILVLQHAEEGAAGIILNRPLGPSSKAVWEQMKLRSSVVERVVHYGGPLPAPVVALHQDEAHREAFVHGEVYLSANPNTLRQLVEQAGPCCRFFVGHAGWGQGQLERELRQGAWMLLPATPAAVFGNEAALWQNAVRAVGRSVLASAIDARRFPPDPGCN